MIADIQVGKAVDNLLPQVGQNVTFTVTVTNLGPTAASNIQLLDHLPLGLSYVPSTVSQGTYDANTGEWSVGGLVLNGVATLTVTGLVGTTAAPSVTNHATKLSSSPFDSVTTNDSAAVIINIEEVADLQVRKTVDNETPAVGASIVYAVSVRNAGPSDATGVVLRDILPAGVSFALFTASQGAYDEATNEWTVGALANGGTATLTVTATVDGPGVVTNLASVAQSNQLDPNSANDSAGVSINGQQVDIHVVKGVFPTRPALGAQVRFLVAAINRGPSPATNVVVRDLLPAGLSFVSASTGSGTYDPATGIWAVGSLDSSGLGALGLLRIVAATTTEGLITNVASLSATDQPDSNPSNDQGSATVEVRRVADLAMAKAVATATPVAGGPLAYALTATNSGPNDASEVRIVDAVPAGTTFVAATPSAGGSCMTPPVGGVGP